MTPQQPQQQENPPMICSAFHRLSVVQPENCYNCVHRHGYPSYLFGDDNCTSFVPIHSHPAPAPAAEIHVIHDQIGKLKTDLFKCIGTIESIQVKLRDVPR